MYEYNSMQAGLKTYKFRVGVYGRGFPFANINIVLDATMTLDDSSQCGKQ